MINNLLETHPKTSALLCEWFQQQFIKSMEDQGLPKDFIEGAKSFVIDNEKVIGLIGKQPRGLFDFFDENGIHINTLVFGKNWSWDIVSVKLTIGSETDFPSRKEAELGGVTKAFEELEEMLNARIPEADTSGGGE
jgi:hypothetical protein